jgi:hypothetical protein
MSRPFCALPPDSGTMKPILIGWSALWAVVNATATNTVSATKTIRLKPHTTSVFRDSISLAVPT